MSLKDMSIYSHLYLCNFTISTCFSAHMIVNVFSSFWTLPDVRCRQNHTMILIEDFLYAFVQIKWLDYRWIWQLKAKKKSDVVENFAKFQEWSIYRYDFNHRSVSQTLSVESRLGTEAEPSSSQISPVNSQPDAPPLQALFHLQSLVYGGMKTAAVQNAVTDFQAPPVMQI